MSDFLICLTNHDAKLPHPDVPINLSVSKGQKLLYRVRKVARRPRFATAARTATPLPRRKALPVGLTADAAKGYRPSCSHIIIYIK